MEGIVFDGHTALVIAGYALAFIVTLLIAIKIIG